MANNGPKLHKSPKSMQRLFEIFKIPGWMRKGKDQDGLFCGKGETKDLG